MVEKVRNFEEGLRDKVRMDFELNSSDIEHKQVQIANMSKKEIKSSFGSILRKIPRPGNKNYAALKRCITGSPG